MNRVYYSSTAHAQYLRVPGHDYSEAGFPLFGDVPLEDYSDGQPTNGTFRDPDRVYDMEDYLQNDASAADAATAAANLPHSNYPDILDVVYENWKFGSIEQIHLGGYMSDNHRASMGFMCASIAMADETFWGGAVVDFCRRYANDPQMWLMFGVNFDYDDAFTAPKTFHRDIFGFGGTGNGWMTDMWEDIVGFPTPQRSPAVAHLPRKPAMLTALAQSVAARRRSQRLRSQAATTWCAALACRVRQPWLMVSSSPS